MQLNTTFLVEFHFEKISEETETNACRCLCNIMFLAKDNHTLVSSYFVYFVSLLFLL